MLFYIASWTVLLAAFGGSCAPAYIHDAKLLKKKLTNSLPEVLCVASDLDKPTTLDYGEMSSIP